MAITLTTPVGRIVQGELWKGREVTDSKGVVKLGTDDKPVMSWFFAVAIAKQPGHTHWAQTEWGSQIWAEGHRAHPNFAPHPTFSWKIEDGDSVIPNKKGKKNCDREGHTGCWILKFSSYYPIDKTYNANGTAPMPPEAFKPGNYVQVSVSVKGNTGETPGVYLNPNMVALSGYGEEIVFGPDVAEAGFGSAPLPAGASPAPLAVANLPGVAAAPAPFAPAGVAPGLPSAPAVAAALPATSPSSVPVTPNPAFLAGPVPPPTPPVPAGPQMTAKAGAFTYAQYIAQGWTDAALRAEGYLV